MSIFCPKRRFFESFFQKNFHYFEGLQISDFHYSHRIYLVKKLVFHELSTIARFPLFRLLLYREYTVISIFITFKRLGLSITIMLQVRFSQLVITAQTHIRKSKILEISLWNLFHSAIFLLDWCGKFFWTKKNLNHCYFTDFVWEMKAFKFLNVSLGSGFYSYFRKPDL